MDKWVPVICIILAAVFGITAYSLWNLNTTAASDNIIKKDVKVKEVQEKTFSKYRILLVPGHDKDDYGAEFKNTKEEKINLDLAKRIYNLFDKDEKFEIFTTRNENGYTDEFQSYFIDQKEEIKEFIYKNKKETRDKYTEGEFEPVRVVEHNLATEDVAFRLYGINRWVNENEIDLVIHIHFNDYPRGDMDEVGKYNGFSIYIPSNNLSGYEESKKIANLLRENLGKFFNESNLPVEKDIVIENSDLIAIGSNNTIVRAAPILVEYGYIYEDIFYKASQKTESLNKAAYQTYDSVREFLNK